MPSGTRPKPRGGPPARPAAANHRIAAISFKSGCHFCVAAQNIICWRGGKPADGASGSFARRSEMSEGRARQGRTELMEGVYVTRRLAASMLNLGERPDRMGAPGLAREGCPGKGSWARPCKGKAVIAGDASFVRRCGPAAPRRRGSVDAAGRVRRQVVGGRVGTSKTRRRRSALPRGRTSTDGPRIVRRSRRRP